MTDPFEIETQGESEFLVRLRGDDGQTESWFRLGPGLRDGLGLDVDDEELVRLTAPGAPGNRAAWVHDPAPASARPGSPSCATTSGRRSAGGPGHGGSWRRPARASGGKVHVVSPSSRAR